MTKRTGRPKTPVTVPLADDLAVYARLVLRYKREPSRDVLALCVLAQRVIVEKAKAYYKRKGRMHEVSAELTRIGADIEYARSLVRVSGGCPRLVGVYPQYQCAGLVG